MDEEYTFVYYDSMGIGEVIRLIFVVARVPYKDIRLPFDFDYEKHMHSCKVHSKREASKCERPFCAIQNKRELTLPPEWRDRVPYGKLPMLLIGNGERKIVSSKPICRYLAAKFDLTAQDPFDDAKCDEYMDSLRDFCDQLRPYIHSKDEDQKAMALARLKNFVIPRYLGKFDAIIATNNGINLVGNKLTWADIYLAHSLRNFSYVLKIDFIEKYPAVANLVNHVYSIPAIQDWVEVRPKTSW